MLCISKFAGYMLETQ